MSGARRGGMTLVEVLVGLVVLQLGLLAAISLSTLAARFAQRAARTEHLVTVLAGVADSLSTLDSPGSGRARHAGVDVVWSATPPYADLVGYLDGADTVYLRIRLADVAHVP